MKKHSFIPDHILASIGDTKSQKLSEILRCKRSGFKKTISNMFNRTLDAVTGRNRETYNCTHTTDLPGTLVLKENSPLTTDDLVVNAGHVNSSTVYAFYASIFNRNSLDDKGMKIMSSVHYDQNYNNAFWNGQEMVYGDGDGKFFIELTRGLDVCAHEMSHAVTQFTCNLWYLGQSGALNESFSDVMGICCKHWANKEFDPSTANWLMGDAIVGPNFPGKAIRSFKDEKAYDGDNQPKNMKNYVYTSSDSMGVHTNSGIPNHQFYLLCNILNKPSYDMPAQIAYRAHTKYMKSWSGFKDYAKAQVRAATELYGATAAQAVKEAWAQVSIKI